MSSATQPSSVQGRLRNECELPDLVRALDTVDSMQVDGDGVYAKEKLSDIRRTAMTRDLRKIEGKQLSDYVSALAVTLMACMNAASERGVEGDHMSNLWFAKTCMQNAAKWDGRTTDMAGRNLERLLNELFAADSRAICPRENTERTAPDDVASAEQSSDHATLERPPESTMESNAGNQRSAQRVHTSRRPRSNGGCCSAM